MRAHECDAVLFDLDGVLTRTAAVHERAWSRLFTDIFATASARGSHVRPYSIDDYFTHIDGKPRADGVRAVLASRGIDLPVGHPDDDSGAQTIHGLGNRKNDMFVAELEQSGVEAFDGAADVLDWLEHRGLPKAVVSSSHNADSVLQAVGLRHRVDLVVDGGMAMALGLAGKPAPDTYLCAAERLSADPARTMVVEDATSGVEAGRRGGFWVVGIDRGAGRDTLIRNGADIVVDELDELFADDRRQTRP